jgi:hypothetical protein
VLLIAPWLPPKIDGNVLVCEVLPSPVVVEDSAGQLFHTQQERLLPTLASTPVMTISPTTNEIPAATRLPNRIERRLLGESGRVGRDKTLDNSALNLSRMPL